MTKQTREEWEKANKWYTEIMGEAGDNLNHNLIRPTLLKLLGNLKGKAVLDAGCGSGYLSAELAQQAKEVVGVDFSEKFIHYCREHYSALTNLSFQVADVSEPLNFQNNSFDFVLSKMVLQYVEDPSVFARESARVVNQQGRVVVVVDHPFHRPFFGHQYFETRAQTKTKEHHGEALSLTWFPKTIANYVRPFFEAGLVLTKLEEMAEEKESVQVPRILFMVFAHSKISRG